MEILNRKENHLNRFAIWKCNQCGSTIKSKIDEGELKDGGNDENYVLVECPVCSKKNGVITSNYKVEDSVTTESYWDR